MFSASDRVRADDPEVLTPSLQELIVAPIMNAISSVAGRVHADLEGALGSMKESHSAPSTSSRGRFARFPTKAVPKPASRRRSSTPFLKLQIKAVSPPVQADAVIAAPTATAVDSAEKAEATPATVAAEPEPAADSEPPATTIAHETTCVAPAAETTVTDSEVSGVQPGQSAEPSADSDQKTEHTGSIRSEAASVEADVVALPAPLTGDNDAALTGPYLENHQNDLAPLRRGLSLLERIVRTAILNGFGAVPNQSMKIPA